MRKRFKALILFISLARLITLHAHADPATTATLTNATTANTTGVTDNQSVNGASGSSNFSTGTTYDITYQGDVRSITSLMAGSTLYEPLAYAGSITTSLVRNSVGSDNNIIYTRTISSSGTSFTQAGPYLGDEETAFNINNLNVGTDNLFGNQGDGNGNNNNIERLDVVFQNGLTATEALAFAVIERGVTNGHDPFKIAAITAIDINGNPTAYGSLVSFGTGSTFGTYGNADLIPSSTDWVVTRNAIVNPGDPATLPSANISNQALGGVIIAVTGDTANSGLGIAANTLIYGYSLFGTDVTGTGGQVLTDVSTFPANTTAGTGGGGIDLVAYTGVAFQAVPEPGSAVLLCAVGLTLSLRRPRRRV